MEKNYPVELGLDDLLNNKVFEMHSESRKINQDIGMVNSFQMETNLFRTEQPYRTKEGRIIRILKGTGRIAINLIEHAVKEKMIVLSPPDSLIELLETSPDYDFQVIAIRKDFLPVMQGAIFNDLHLSRSIRLSLTDEEWECSGHFCSLLWKVLQKRPFRREVVQHIVTALLYNIRYIYDRNQVFVSSRLTRQEEIFRRFIALVNQHSKLERTVHFYADKLCLTPHYLSTVIREASGQTVMQWINQAVILEAKVLLKHSNLPVFQVSDELSFPNPSFFSKFFKRMTGMTPVEYQKQI